ncbi:MAG: class I SAM-dependent methyltransferase, partial [Alphaproteobacteria bacterium]
SNWRWRGYNEQLGIAAILTRSSQEILMSSHYVTTRMAAEFERTQISKLPILPGASENSLWLKIC